MVRSYGWYSNAARGTRQMMGIDDEVPCIREPLDDDKASRKNWARLIQKIGACPREGGESRSPGLPKTCPEPADGCQGPMRIISSIADRQVIRAILEHLGLWLVKARPPPKRLAPLAITSSPDDLSPSFPPDVQFYGDPEYTWNDYIQS